MKRPYQAPEKGGGNHPHIQHNQADSSREGLPPFHPGRRGSFRLPVTYDSKPRALAPRTDPWDNLRSSRRTCATQVITSHTHHTAHITSRSRLHLRAPFFSFSQWSSERGGARATFATMQSFLLPLISGHAIDRGVRRKPRGKVCTYSTCYRNQTGSFQFRHRRRTW